MLKYFVAGLTPAAAFLAISGAVAVSAQEQAPIKPPTNVSAQAVEAEPKAAEPKAPPKTAIILKLQEQILDLQAENGRLSAENASLKKVLLDEAKKRSAADILKEWGGKPGDSIDWTTLTKVAAPASPKAAPKP